jgi:3-hydroxyisobutyrate dehydrogenase
VTPIRRVGFVGLGNMGLPIAGRIAAAGFEVRAYDAREQLAGGMPPGVAWEPDPGALAADADALMLCLPDGAVVREVLLGAPGLADRMRRGAAVVDLSSSAPAGTAAVGAALAERELGMVDAPVSGGVARARTGQLTAMVGGDPALVERCRPLLHSIAARVLPTGRLGSGHATKALNNYVSAAGLLAALEALAAAERFGVEPAVALDVLNVSSGRNNSTETKIGQFVLNERFASGFDLALMAKDVRTAQRLARLLGVPSRLLDACADLWDEAAAGAGTGTDHTAVGGELGLGLGRG